MKNKKGAIVIEGHVQGLANTRALGKEGIPVIVIDKNRCVAQSSKYCKKFLICPDFQDDLFIDFLIELANKEHLEGWVLIPSNDHAVYNISKHYEKLVEFYKTTVPKLNILDEIYDKSKLLNLALNLNIPIPLTYYFNDINDIENNLPYPLLTKGKTGLSFYKVLKKKAFLANNKTEFEVQLNKIQEKIPLDLTFTQELIPFDGTNKTISFAAFCDKGDIKTYWMGIKLREHPLQFGTATFTESVYIEDCLIHSKKLLKELNYTGVCEIEFLKDPRDEEYKLIEINARTWLCVGHAIACGVNYPKIIFDYVNGNDIIYPDSYDNGVKWVNLFTDLPFSFYAFLKGKLNLYSYLISFKGKIKNAILDFNDLKPLFSYINLAFSFIKNR